MLVAVAVGSVALPARAIEYGGIGGRPANPDPSVPRSDSIFVYSLAGGATRDDAIILLNNTNEAKTLAVYPTDALVSSGGALACRQQVEEKTEVGSWITLAESEVTVPPLSQQAVDLTIAVPAGVGPGEHNGCIAIQEQGQQPKQQPGGIALNTRTAIRVAVTVPGDIRREVTITGHSINRSPNGGYLDHVQAKNAGNVSVEADLKTTVRYLFWVKQSGAGGKFSLLPKVEADYNFDIKKPFWGLLYLSQVSATYDRDGNGAQVKASGPTRLFWVWPEPLAAVIEIIALLALVGGVWFFKRIRRQRAALAQLKSYTVKRGETLSVLAQRSGVSPRALAKANSLAPSYRLKARQRIKVPKQGVSIKPGRLGRALRKVTRR